MKELFWQKGIKYDYYDIQYLPDKQLIAIKKRAKDAGLRKFPIVELPNGQLAINEDLISYLQEEPDENY